jgi:alkanesulfonate monooxygenase SsuD/methylene tetrahydromethanopterin reductase-like flavin-dependent oxidoreductase (luciferase family)
VRCATRRLLWKCEGKKTPTNKEIAMRQSTMSALEAAHTEDRWSQAQRDMANRIAEECKVGTREEVARELLKWALARVTFYGPSEEPCAQVIREWLETGRVDHR